MENPTMNIEKTANAIVRSVNNYNGNLKDAMSDDFGDLFYEAAACIVEPANVGDDYYEFMESDPENWASWIRELCGEDWGVVAMWVNQNGY